jgi:hypothetical protein
MWGQQRRWWLGGCVFAAAVLPALRPAPASQGVSGIDVFRTSCEGCHDLPDPENPRRSRAEWQAVLTKMVREKGATLNDKEFAAVLDYLDSFNQPHAEPAWKEQPAASHRAEFIAAQMGKLPDNWISLSPGGGRPGSWAVRREPAGKVFALGPDHAAAEGPQLLIDNSGSLTSATIAARVRLPATGEGAGLVFGFRGAHSYFAARLSATTRDLAVYQVDQTDRALIGKVPMAVTPSLWNTLAATFSPRQFQVDLNGKQLLTRPLTAYRGGRAGLIAEASTAPAFASWAVTVAK